MTLVQFAILSNLCGVLVVMAASLAVQRRHPQAFFRSWVQAYLGCSVIFSLDLLRHLLQHPRWLEAMALLAIASTTWLYWRTGQTLKESKVPRLLSWGYAGSCGALLLMFLLKNQGFFPLFIAPILVYTASIVWLGATILRLGTSNAGARSHWVGYPIIAMGLWAFTFPLFDGKPYLWVGYWISGLLNIGVGVGMLIFLLEHANRILEHQNQQLKALDQLKMNFLSTVSHELRTPLTSIIGYLELMQEGIGGPLSEQQTHFVEGMRRGSSQLAELVNALLDSMQMQAGQLKVQCSPIDPTGLIQETLSSFQPLCDKHQLRLEFTPAPLPIVMADPQRLTQVLNNLLSNAVKFTPEGGFVRLCVTPENDRLVVTVEDTGIGISPEVQRRIFEPFYQADNTLTRPYGGSGLGLPITRTLVTAMGGELEIESEVGRGSRFRFHVPIVREASEPLAS